MVVHCGVQPQYFLDEMQPYELAPLLDANYNRYKNQWEQVRFITYVQAQTQSDKKLTPQDIIRFNWEQEEVEEVTPEELQQRKQAMLDFMIKVKNKEIVPVPFKP